MKIKKYGLNISAFILALGFFGTSAFYASDSDYRYSRYGQHSFVITREPNSSSHVVSNGSSSSSASSSSSSSSQSDSSSASSSSSSSSPSSSSSSSVSSSSSEESSSNSLIASTKSFRADTGASESLKISSAQEKKVQEELNIYLAQYKSYYNSFIGDDLCEKLINDNSLSVSAFRKTMTAGKEYYERGKNSIMQNHIAPKEVGDPVLLGRGTYHCSKKDLSFKYGLNTYNLERNYYSGESGGGVLGRCWHSALDTRIIRGSAQWTRKLWRSMCSQGYKLGTFKTRFDSFQKTIRYPQNATYNQDVKIRNLDTNIKKLLERYNKCFKKIDAEYKASQKNDELNSYLQKDYKKYGQSLPNGSIAYVDERGIKRILVLDSESGKYLPVKEENQDMYAMIGTEAEGGKISIFYLDGREKVFDKNGFPESIKDRYGMEIKFNYEKEAEEERRISSLSHNGNVMISFIYNSSGLLSQAKSFYNEESVIFTYTNGILSSVKESFSNPVSYIYDSYDYLIKIVEKDGGERLIEYGSDMKENRRVVSVVSPGGSRESFLFDQSELCLTYTDGDGMIEKYFLDDNLNVIKKKVPGLSDFEWTYDERGNVIKYKTPFGTTKYTYDIKGNILTEYNPENALAKISYSPSYNLINCYENRDAYTSFFYDSKGNLKTVRITLDPFKIVKSITGSIEQISYNQWGAPLSVSGFRQNAEFEYDSFYRLVSDENWDRVYRQDGSLSLKTDKSGNKWMYDLDKISRSLKVEDPFGLEIKLYFDENDNLVSILEKDPKNSLYKKKTYKRDPDGRIIEIYSGKGTSEKEAESFSVLKEKYFWTSAGRLKSVLKVNYGPAVKNDSYGLFTEYAYNSQGELSSEKKYFVDSTLNKKGKSWSSSFTYEYQNAKKIVSEYCDGILISRAFYDFHGRCRRIEDGKGRGKEYTFKEAGLLSGETFAEGGKISYISNGTSLRTFFVYEGNSNIKTFRYDSAMKLSKVKDSDGSEILFSFLNSEGNILRSQERKSWKKESKTSKLGEKEIFLSKNYTDMFGNSLEENFSFDPQSRTLTVQEGNESFYKKCDAWQNVIYDSLNDLSFEYDDEDRISLVYQYSNGRNNVYSFSYNVFGKVSQFSLNDQPIYSYFYDPRGLLLETRDNLGSKWKGEWNEFSKIKWEEGRLLDLREYEYDEGGIVKSCKINEKNIITFSWNENLTECKVFDAKGKSSSYFYDEYGRLKKYFNRLGDVSYLDYDSSRSSLSFTSFEGKKKEALEDKNLGIVNISDSDSKTEIIQKDGMGQIVFIQSKDGSGITFNYEGKNLVSSDDGTRKVKYRTEGRNQYVSIDDVDFIYTYNTQGLLESVEGGGYSSSFEYDWAGREIRRYDSSGVSVERLYDDDGREIQCLEKDKNKKNLFAQRNIYDEKGHLTWVFDNNGNASFYSYDSLGRLSKSYIPYSSVYKKKSQEELEELGKEISMTEEKLVLPYEVRTEYYSFMKSLGLSSKIAEETSVWKEVYTYDVNSNLISLEDNCGKKTFVYNDEDCLISIEGPSSVSFFYDRNGNLLSRDSKLKNERYSYDSSNRLISRKVTDKKTSLVKEWNFSYDPLGRLVRETFPDGKTLRTLYYGTGFSKLCQFIEGEDNSVLKNNSTEYRNRMLSDEYVQPVSLSCEEKDYCPFKRYFAIRGESLIFQINSNTFENESLLPKSSVHSYVADRNNNVRSVLSWNGSLLYSLDYTPYGFSSAKIFNEKNVAYRSSSSVEENTGLESLIYDGGGNSFASKEWKRSYGAYDFGYRIYNPSIARFTTIDPAYSGTNLYAYCMCNPIDFIDCRGLRLEIFVDATNGTMSYVFSLNGKVIEQENFDNGDRCPKTAPVTTAVASWDNRAPIDWSRTVSSSGTFPAKIPAGTYKITECFEYQGDNESYKGPWLRTDAAPYEYTEDGKVVEGSGYCIHNTDSSNTNGCIGVHQDEIMEKLAELYKKNEEIEPGSSFLVVNYLTPDEKTIDYYKKNGSWIDDAYEKRVEKRMKKYKCNGE